MRRSLSLAILLPMLLSLLGMAAAQQSLVVNGVVVPGATSNLVPGVAYAPATDLARALGADLSIDTGMGRVTLSLGAAIVQVALVDEVGRANAVTPAIHRDGSSRPGPAAVYDGLEPYLPVKGVGEAFGGMVSFLADSNTVALVLPRPSLGMRSEGFGASQRLVFSLSAPGRVSSFEHPNGVLELRFDRADPLASVSLDGDAFVRASLASVRGTAEARVQLEPGMTARILTLPNGVGTEVVVAFGAAPPPEVVAVTQGRRLVLDAGPVPMGLDLAGGEDELVRGFVDALAQGLSSSGMDVSRTRPGPSPVPLSERAAMGAGADAFVSIQLGTLPPGTVRLYVLDDASGALDLDQAIRWNAEAALNRPETDAVRRAILLRLVPRLDLGRRMAETLAVALPNAGLTAGAVRGAPLAVLMGAAGRGLLIEMSAHDMRDPGTSLALATALATALAGLP